MKILVVFKDVSILEWRWRMDDSFGCFTSTMSRSKFMCFVTMFYVLKPKQNGYHFVEDSLKYNFLKEDARISITILLKFVLKAQMNDIPALVHLMAWHLPGDKPLSDTRRARLLTYICVTRLQCNKLLATIAVAYGTTPANYFRQEGSMSLYRACLFHWL